MLLATSILSIKNLFSSVPKSWTLKKFESVVDRINKILELRNDASDLDKFRESIADLSIQQLDAKIQEYNHYFNSDEIIRIQSFFNEKPNFWDIPEYALDLFLDWYIDILPELESFIQKTHEMLIMYEKLKELQMMKSQSATPSPSFKLAY